jgi:hypothetical protein
MITLMRAFLLFLFLASFVVSDSGYYADVVFDVEDSGLVRVSGVSNHPQLMGDTHEWTGKRGEAWVFNASLDGRFTDLVYSIRLPEGALINYVRTSGQFRIANEGGRVTVNVAGRDLPVKALIQYSIEPPVGRGWFYHLILLAAIVVFFALAALKRMRGRPKAGFGGLTYRQKQIMDYVAGSRSPVSQQDICDALKLPKSSVSRNVETLVRLKALKKVRTGVSTVITVNDSG